MCVCIFPLTSTCQFPLCGIEFRQFYNWYQLKLLMIDTLGVNFSKGNQYCEN